MRDPKKRIDATLLVEYNMSSPNGDPDNDNRPRILDREGASYAYTTDSCIRRSVRDFAQKNHGVNLYVAHGAVLSEVQAAYATADALVKDLWDGRVFGGTFTKFGNKGRVTAPFGFDTRSTHPVTEITLRQTRVAGEKQDQEKLLAKMAKKANQAVEDMTDDDRQLAEDARRANMGSHTVLQHALMRTNISYTPNHGDRTGVTPEDMAILWDSLVGCWGDRKSSSRPDIRFRRLVVFEHDNARGRAHGHKLQDRVRVDLDPILCQSGQPTAWSDYDITVDTTNLPAGITVHDFDDNTMGFPV
jgi:CRISPR-associated protein Csd2